MQSDKGDGPKKEDSAMRETRTFEYLGMVFHATDECRGPEDLRCGIWGISKCNDGAYYPHHEDWFVALEPTTRCAKTLTYRCPATMGCRLAYVLLGDGRIIRAELFGRQFRVKDIKRLISEGGVMAWGAILMVHDTWIIDGRVEVVTESIDLDPARSIQHALAWAGALTGRSTGVLTNEDIYAENE
jgi:hypothetical protein